jgi:hypothetical protein
VGVVDGGDATKVDRDTADLQQAAHRIAPT